MTKQSRKERRQQIFEKYDSWVNNHSRLLNFFNNDVGYFSDIMTIAGMVVGVSDVFVAVKAVKEVDEVADVGKGLEMGEIKGVDKGGISDKSGSVLSRSTDISAKKVSTLNNISRKLTLVSDYTGIASGAAQGIQSPASGAGHGAVFGVIGGMLNTGFSMVEIHSIGITRKSEDAEKAFEDFQKKNPLRKEGDGLYDAIKDSVDTTKQDALRIAKRSDRLNLALGFGGSIVAGIYYSSTGSPGSGAATLAYGASYGIVSFPNEIRGTWKYFFKDI